MIASQRANSGEEEEVPKLQVVAELRRGCKGGRAFERRGQVERMVCGGPHTCTHTHKLQLEAFKRQPSVQSGETRLTSKEQPSPLGHQA